MQGVGRFDHSLLPALLMDAPLYPNAATKATLTITEEAHEQRSKEAAQSWAV
jgi:hypothetical protein